MHIIISEGPQPISNDDQGLDGESLNTSATNTTARTQLIELPDLVKFNTTDGVVGGQPTASSDGCPAPAGDTNSGADRSSIAGDRTDSLERSSDEVVMLEAPAPLIDAFKLSVHANSVLSGNYDRRIREGFALTSRRATTKFPKAHRRCAFRVVPVVRRLQPRPVVEVSVAMDGNGMVWLRERFEPASKRRPPIALDGNTNIFEDQAHYGRAESFYLEQLKFLEEQVTAANVILDAAYNAVGMRGPETYLFVYTLELAWHKLCAPSEAEQFLLEVFKAARTKWESKIILDSGVQCKIREGFVLSIYRKQSNLIRFEARLGFEFFRKDDEWATQKNSSLELQINHLRRRCWPFVKELMVPSPSPSDVLSPADALMQFDEIAKRSRMDILRRLIIGGGRITTSAKDPCYRGIMRLEKDGIFERGLSRGEFRLTRHFYALLKLFSPSSFHNMAMTKVNSSSSG